MHPYVLSPTASRSLLPSPYHHTTPISFRSFTLHAHKVRKEVNALSKVMSLQIRSTNLIVGG